MQWCAVASLESGSVLLSDFTHHRHKTFGCDFLPRNIFTSTDKSLDAFNAAVFHRVTNQSSGPFNSLLDADLISFFLSFFHLYAKSAKEQLSGTAALRDPNLSDTKWKCVQPRATAASPARTRRSAGVDGGSAPGTSDGHMETSLRLVSDTDDEAECVITAPRSDGMESKQLRGTWSSML